MLLLFIGCLTCLNDFNVKVQCLPGERVVGIDGHGLIIHFHDTNDLGTARSLRLELHTGLDGVNAFKGRARNRLDQLFVQFAVALGRFNRNLYLIARALFVQRTFQSTDNVLCTFQIGQRLTTFYTGGVKLLSLFVSERVMDGDNTRLGHVISLRVAMTV